VAQINPDQKMAASRDEFESTHHTVQDVAYSISVQYNALYESRRLAEAYAKMHHFVSIIPGYSWLAGTNAREELLNRAKMFKQSGDIMHGVYSDTAHDGVDSLKVIVKELYKPGERTRAELIDIEARARNRRNEFNTTLHNTEDPFNLALLCAKWKLSVPIDQRNDIAELKMTGGMQWRKPISWLSLVGLANPFGWHNLIALKIAELDLRSAAECKFVQVSLDEARKSRQY
jgi:hypothetical protein